ncbi:hypothetical protein C9374_002699 [Naegleria lovaniensis]|uniref:RRM domain-containing protein n=1 Tax=Naegleria lovaniensis TaxID=51637 RepID=A0AA88GTZ5_NAELO|nr:uncharacterized protein C9374_002699 [Naegleria lovaniensis]KAG2386253.1 hypothetical protein C9374_002699 [Naegleria lovaniensis]
MLHQTSHHHHHHRHDHKLASSSSHHDQASSSATQPIESVQGFVIFLSNIDINTEEDTLKDVLSDYGRVISLHYELSRRTGYPIGYALVKYETREEAQQAIHALNEKHKFGNKIVRADWCFKEGPPIITTTREELQEIKEDLNTQELDQQAELNSESSNDSSVLKRKRDSEWDETSEATTAPSEERSSFSTTSKSENIVGEEISQQEQIAQEEPPQKKNK